mgnify:CR=1 FL=1
MEFLRYLTHAVLARLAAALGVIALTLGALFATPGAAMAADQDGDGQDDSLNQTLSSDEPVVNEPRTIASGHVDIGPRFEQGTWALYAHDDTVSPPVWRPLDQTILKSSDAAIQPAPEGQEWAFLGVDPGTPLYIYPQVESADAAWVGWNTQDPEVMERVDRGVQLQMTKVDGPGQVKVFLQAGDFSGADVLWDSEAQNQALWVDVNTHTHANWVFTAPGEYLVWMTMSAKLLDGTEVTTTQPLRFAVGDSASPEALLAKDAGEAPVAAAPNGEQPAAAGGPSMLDGILISVFVLLLVAIVFGVTVVIVRGNRARRRAMQGEL